MTRLLAWFRRWCANWITDDPWYDWADRRLDELGK